VATIDVSVTVNPAQVPPLPVPGNLQAQLAQANQFATLAKQAQSLLETGGDAASEEAKLAAAGVTLASGFISGGSGSTGTLVRTMVNFGTSLVTNIASGAAVGGPFGAAAGALISLFSGIGGQAPPYVGMQINSTNGSLNLYRLTKQWGGTQGGMGPGSNKPQGQSFCEYLIFKCPPSTTLRPRRMYWGAGSSGAFDQQSLSDISDPHNEPRWPLDADSIPLAEKYAKEVSPIDPAVLWNWAEPTTGPTSPQTWDQAFGGGSTVVQTEGPAGEWWQDTVPISPGHGQKGMSVGEIQASALRRAPDPMYFAMDLYIVEWSADYGTGANIEQTALASGIATVCGLLAVGAKTVSIVRELQFQQNKLYTQDGSGGGAAFTPEAFAAMVKDGTFPKTMTLAEANRQQAEAVVPPLFRQLVEDYIALAHLEAKKGDKATMREVVLANRPHEASSTPSAAHGISSDEHAKAQSVAAAKQAVIRFVSLYLGR
jgi:hypothetical protein